MIKLVKNYKYDNKYTHIKLFKDKAEQDSYFNNLDSLYIEENNYIKEHNSFKVGYEYDYLVSLGVNYLIFNNGYKDMYCFITSKEYISSEVTQINFEVDVLNTYLFDFEIKKSFVERKNCTIDEITDFDEGLDIGEHIIETEHHIFDKDSTYFAMFNGIKEQSLVFNDSGKLVTVIDFPFPTSKPLTIIDGIQYPLYFMPLKETYKQAEQNPILPPTGGDIPSGNGSDVVTSARKLIGKPYVWGGNYPPLGTDEGTDCSGLCQWAYNDCGLLTKVGLGGRWTTYTMIEHATYIKEPSVAKPGDVIFSRFENGYPEHVALISGIDGNMISIVEAQQEGVPILERTLVFDSTQHEIRRFLNG